MSAAVGSFRTAVRIATELLQLSLRGYDDCRFGVTAVAVSGLRRLSLRGYDKRRFGTSVNTAVCGCCACLFSDA
ncbi:MAG: hypothetical protein HXN55_07960 [Prevotella nigrescens]|uniref:Uncharacterized protein n=1 Tax=Prevotella nigrescens TaxID=28133 RepID=A0A9D5X0W4_9BACT|nr:hypothetical protein [Prevotella nigrescens]MBF1447297.1 hypothetical protein [Prevotella nigrescens]MBF1453757.1 hypothetical protein [Prevotella nigrescens]